MSEQCSFKKGDRIRLIQMGPDPNPVKPGTLGTVATNPVYFIKDWQICVKWDDGRTLGLICPPDKAEKIA